MASVGKIKEKKGKNLSEDSIPSFIRKTYEILEEGQYYDCIHWSDDGTAIVISNPTDFAQKVLPAYFKHNNLTSFIRQLNMYDFHKKRSLNMDHVYYHELFQRGKKHLLKEIRRKNSESTTPGSDKVLPLLESTQTRQDLAAVVHENVLLKKINQENLSRTSVLESNIKDLTLENQTLWNQIYQLREKESLMKNGVMNFMKQNGLSLGMLPPYLQGEFDFTLLNSKDQKDNSPSFIPQTTTKTHFPSGSLPFSQASQQNNSYQAFPQQLDASGGGTQPIFLEGFGKGKGSDQGNLVGDTKLFPSPFDYNLQAQNPWNMNFPNLKTTAQSNNDKLKATPTFPDENTTPNFTNYGKRRFVDPQEKEDAENPSKKVKPSPGFGAGESKQKQGTLPEQENRSYNTGMGAVPFNIKEEGMAKKTSEGNNAISLR